MAIGGRVHTAAVPTPTSCLDRPYPQPQRLSANWPDAPTIHTPTSTCVFNYKRLRDESPQSPRGKLSHAPPLSAFPGAFRFLQLQAASCSLKPLLQLLAASCLLGTYSHVPTVL